MMAVVIERRVTRNDDRPAIAGEVIERFDDLGTFRFPIRVVLREPGGRFGKAAGGTRRHLRAFKREQTWHRLSLRRDRADQHHFLAQGEQFVERASDMIVDARLAVIVADPVPREIDLLDLRCRRDLGHHIAIENCAIRVLRRIIA